MLLLNCLFDEVDLQNHWKSGRFFLDMKRQKNRPLKTSGFNSWSHLTKVTIYRTNITLLAALKFEDSMRIMYMPEEAFPLCQDRL
jgi:hypothetical protein